MGKGLLSRIRKSFGVSRGKGDGSKGSGAPDPLDANTLRDPLNESDQGASQAPPDVSSPTALGLSSLVDIADASGSGAGSSEDDGASDKKKSKRSLGKRLKDLFADGSESGVDTTGMGTKLGLSSHAGSMQESLAKALPGDGDDLKSVEVANKVAGLGGGTGKVAESLVDGGEAVLKATTTSGKLGAASEGAGKVSSGVGTLIGDTAKALGNDDVGKYSGAAGGAVERLGGLGKRGAGLYDVFKDKEASKGKKARAAVHFGLDGAHELGQTGNLVRGAVEGSDDTEAGFGMNVANTAADSAMSVSTIMNKDASTSDRIKGGAKLVGNAKKGLDLTAEGLKHAKNTCASDALKANTGGVGAGLGAVSDSAGFVGTLFDKKATKKDKLKAGGKALASGGSAALATASDISKWANNDGAGDVITKVSGAYGGMTGGVGTGFGLAEHLVKTVKGVKNKDVEEVTKNGLASASDVATLVKHGANIATPFLTGGAATTAASVAGTADVVSGAITGGAGAAINAVGASKDAVHAAKLTKFSGAGKATRGLLVDTERPLAESWGINTEDEDWDKAFHKRFAKEDEASWKSEADREAFETNPLVKRYLDAAKLNKNRKFLRNQQIKAGVAKSIDGVGDALNLAGTFTAEADFGATKITGVAIKTGVMGARLAQKASDRAAQTSAAVDLDDTLKGYNKQGAIGKGLTKIKEHTYDPAAKVARQAGGWVKDNAIDPAAEGLREHVLNSAADLGRKAGRGLKGVGKFLGGKIKGAAKAVGGKVGAAAGWAKENMLDPVGAQAAKAGKYVGGKAADAATYVGGKASDAAGWTKENMLDPAAAQVTKAGKYVGGKVSDAATYVGGKAGDAAGWTKENMLDPAAAGLTKAGGYVADRASAAATQVGGKVSDAAGWAKENMLDPAAAGLTKAGGYVADKLGEGATYAGGKAGAAAAWAKGKAGEAGAWMKSKGEEGGSWLSEHVVDPTAKAAKSAAGWTKDHVVDPTAKAAKSAAGWTKDHLVDPTVDAAKSAAGWTKDHLVDPTVDAAKSAAGWTKDHVVDPTAKAAKSAAGWTKDHVVDPSVDAANRYVVNPTKKAATWTKENIWETSDMKWARKAGAFFKPKGSDKMLEESREKLTKNRDNEHLTKLRDTDYKAYHKLEERLGGNKKNRAVAHLTKMAASDDEAFSSASKKVIKAVGINPDKEGADKKLRAKMDF